MRNENWFWDVQKYGLKALAHMTDITNIENILEHGILNNYEVKKRNLITTDISNPEVQRWRDRCDNTHNRSIHEYVPAYIRPKNSMLSALRNRQDNLCILQVSLAILEEHEFLFTDGNAASLETKFYDDLKNLDKLPWDVIRSTYWSDFVDGKRKVCSEFLIFPYIPVEYVMCMHFRSETAYARVKTDCGIPRKITPSIFF